MSVASFPKWHMVESVVELARELDRYIRDAARQAKPLHEVERDILHRVLQIGHASVEQLIAVQGNGDLGPSITAGNGRRLQRSPQPVKRPLRTVFGKHAIQA
jgi:hypothetical protein